MNKNKIVRIAVIDGQGGGIGAQIVNRLSVSLPASKAEILALGTNSLATRRMYKAGANDAASGENAIIYNTKLAGIILGTVGMITPFGFNGEMTTAAAEAVALSPAPKLVLHLNRSGIEVIGSAAEPLPHLVDMMVDRVRQMLDLTPLRQQ
ncbi:protein of unknown function [Desulfotomaculum arcticum]|uniref:DUF3842 family protein n=1 Tax=Desulfotruncus arcticus DSM 17038 TaxID=1121424 RepID=A0A1I2SV53_9FIRM|nr:DUF3842 family protein [Desulfotruncus arcticus]SFG56622.1 protein of unknown function [Desulfotomaculum arcticum] [Desulfotruncus arcticus DSM 17038]